MPRCALTMDSGVEHAANVAACDGSPVHANADETTRKLVHHCHEHPVGSEHDRLAAKEVHAPQDVCGVSDERQPRGPVPPEVGR